MAFPLVLVLLLACFQITHLWIARMTVQYAAYCAARAALVSEPSEYNGVNSAPQRAAEKVCAFIVVGESLAEAGSRISAPYDSGGTNVLISGSGAVRRKVHATAEEAPPWNVRASVTLDFALVTPIVGPMIAWGMNPWSADQPWATHLDETGNAHIPTDLVPYPHVKMSESVTLAKPYKTVTPTGWN